MLVLLGTIREILGSGTVFGAQILGDWFDPWMIMILPPGAFFSLGLIIGAVNWYNDRGAK